MYYETIRDNLIYYHKGDNLCDIHFHRAVEIMYVLKGEKSIYVNGNHYLLKEKEILLCVPYVSHHFEKSDNGNQIVFAVPVDYCKNFEIFCKNNYPVTPIVKDDSGEYLSLILGLENPSNGILFVGKLNCLLGSLIEKMIFEFKNKPKMDMFIKEVIEYINENYKNNLTLSNLANHFGYVENYFSMLFKKLFRMNITQYINSIRIEKSLKLLENHKISVIYSLCGFKSPQQYFLNFKKIYNCTPKEYLDRLK